MNKKLLTVLAVGVVGVALAGCDHEMEEKDVPMVAEVVMDEAVILDMEEMTDAPKMMAKYTEYSAEMFEMIKGEQKFAVFFYADWCSTCRKWEKNLQANLASLPEGTLILKADYDTEKDLVEELGVTSQSTVVFFNMDGSVAEIGMDSSPEELKAFFMN